MSHAIRRITVLAAFLWAGPLLAGSQCRLTGTVTDSSGAALEGVSLVVTTPNMTTFRIASQVRTRRANGDFC